MVGQNDEEHFRQSKNESSPNRKKSCRCVNGYSNTPKNYPLLPGRFEPSYFIFTPERFFVLTCEEVFCIIEVTIYTHMEVIL